MVAPSADPSKVAKRVYLEAGPCPVNPAHKTRVYHTEGKVRNCACDDCGATFKKVGNYADPLRDAADSLATMFETSESVVVEEGGPEVILVEAAEARSFAARLRKLLP
jgi:hypothetical protein